MSADVTFDIVTASICALLIIVRCGYRILLRCKVHDTCHRMWHVDDAYMAFALLPLIGRTTCISLSFYLNPTHTYDAATEEAAAARNLSVEKLAEYYVISHKLLIPARIFYALLDTGTHSEASTPSNTVIHSMWSPDPTGANTCHRALGNLVTMAVFNIITDIALIIFPFPIFRHVKLDSKVKVQLVLLFSIAGVVVVITILRLPMILNQAVSQRSRSMATIFITSFITSLLTSLYPRLAPGPVNPHPVNIHLLRPDTMPDLSTLSTLSSYTFGGLCVLSGLPFIGIPFPNRRVADYYAGKSEWMSQIFGRRLSPRQAGYFGAALRIAVGAAVVAPETRESALLFNGAVVTYGTIRAYADGRPMLPQWGMLAANAVCLGLGRFS
ncbi:hypothetical protein CSAL01_09215 [Colletotrichum salicis]|uniref:Rhodopsin domain-containing protein n=1 Tax=Colletotrichum salicis TaxID=1209931 RepID=A0A135U128_9PEZI|nr:hypothetical protein CSAL01_09215 [Colletotrichum salicis]